MNFTTFPVASTNIFPITNSTKGGQLVTEWNLRTRETVDTPSSIKYMVGHSFTHCLSDFEVSLLKDEVNDTISSSAIQIAPGRAIINGHFVEELAPMSIDLLEANAELQSRKLPALKGVLKIGIRAMYSTLQTIAGSMEAEGEHGMYEGLQIVILPEKEFILPIDSPNDQSKVTAHLYLASFTFLNGQIVGMKQNPAKIQYLPAERLSNISGTFNSTYITKNNLDPKNLYVFSGKGTDPKTGQDTWCKAQDSLVIWDKNPVVTTQKPTLQESEFGVALDGSVRLTMPHKQVDGMVNTAGKSEYYKNKELRLPVADYSRNSSGTVDRNYTKNIKNIQSKINNFYLYSKGGKQIRFIENLDTVDDRYGNPIPNLPKIKNSWKVGDYVLVLQDQYIATQGSQDTAGTSTMYVILPGYVQEVQFIVGSSPETPEPTEGYEIARIEIDDSYIDTLKEIYADLRERGVITSEIANVEAKPDDILSYLKPANDTNNALKQPIASILYEVFGLGANNDRGRATSNGKGEADYYTIVHKHINKIEVNNNGKTEIIETTTYFYYYFGVTRSGAKTWSEPIILTGHIPFSSEDVIGGFLNVPDSVFDSGYVYQDSDGHLRLLDYDLLRTGVLAYQLGQNMDIGVGLSAEEIQSQLDNYVNDRVAFPNQSQYEEILATDIEEDPVYRDAYVIHLTLHLPKASDNSEVSTINLRNIDSRFGASVYLHVVGEENSNTILNIVNCEKLRIDNNITGAPTIRIDNVCLYYDPVILNYISRITRMTLWHQQYKETDPQIIVDGLTVRELNPPVKVDDIDYWNKQVPDDNHYMWALNSITFSPEGDIIGFSLAVKNGSTSNITVGDKILVSKFTLPQGLGLHYPETRLTKPLHVSGSFTNAYPVIDPGGYMVMDTNFSATTQVYDNLNDYDPSYQPTGVIAFHRDAKYLDNVVGIDPLTPIDCWDANTYHIFQGGVL